MARRTFGNPAPVLVAIALQGCSSGPATPSISPAVPTIYAVRGGLTVIPVEVRGARRPLGSIDCSLDDGRALDCSLHWIGVSATDSLVNYHWLPDPLDWQVWPADADAAPTPAGVWVAAIDLPGDAVGQGLWIDDRRFDIIWVPDPSVATIDGMPMVWESPVPPAALESPYLGRLVDPVRHNPLTRWRYRLILEGLVPRPPDSHIASDVGAFDDPVLEAFGAGIEDLWRAAIARLRQDDAEVAHDFVRRLVDVVDFGDAVYAPAWPTDQLVLETLRDAVLSPRSTRDSRIQAVRQWLEEQPRAVAWVIDDAGQVDAATGNALATIGVANLGRALKLGAVVDPRRPTERDVVAIRAGAAARLSIPVDEPGEGRTTSRVEIELGPWRTARAIAAEPIPARPPGVALGPLFGDWTMAGWFAGGVMEHRRADGRPAMGARLQRIDQGPGESRWWVYAECLRPLDDRYAEPLAGADWLRLWIGPYENPSAVYRIWRDGRVHEESVAREGGPVQVEGAKVVDEGDRWTCLVPIDDSLIEPGGTLRIGLERMDSRGRRWAWPEPMLPWQIEPARIGIDVTAWDVLTGAAR
jgi:hypothetical protein